MAERDFRRIQIANLLAPATGWLLSLIGLIMLIVQSSRHGDGWQIASCTIYGLCLFISYTAFSLYHLYHFHPRCGWLLRFLDHATIYLLIAGTYTPFTLVYLRGHWGWTLFASVWGLALSGIVFKAFFLERFRILSPLIYLFMGWLLILFIEPALNLIPSGGFKLLLAGGLWYSGGLFFYSWNGPRFHHAIWHLFVLAGSTCHYLAVYWYVALRGAT